MCDERCDHEAYLAWGTLALFILVFDYMAIKFGNITLSEAFYRIREHPLRHAIGTAIWAGVTIHLFRSNDDR